MPNYPASPAPEKPRRRKRQAVVCSARDGYNGIGKAAERRRSDNPRRTAMRRHPIACASIATVLAWCVPSRHALAAPLGTITQVSIEMINAAQDHLEDCEEKLKDAQR